MPSPVISVAHILLNVVPNVAISKTTDIFAITWTNKNTSDSGQYSFNRTEVASELQLQIVGALYDNIEFRVQSRSADNVYSSLPIVVTVPVWYDSLNPPILDTISFGSVTFTAQ